MKYFCNFSPVRGKTFSAERRQAGLLYNLAPALKPGARVGIVDAIAPNSEHGTPPSLLRCELGVVGYREIAFHPLTGSNAYLAIFALPSDESRGVGKYSSAGLLVSSAGRGWSGLSAELRSHSEGIVAWKSTQPDTEISIDMRGNGSIGTRQGGGIFERTVAERGTIWCPPPGCRRILSISQILCQKCCISIFRRATFRRTV